MFLLRYIQSTCATSGEGLYEGLDWLSNNIANKASLIPKITCCYIFLLLNPSECLKIFFLVLCAIAGLMILRSSFVDWTNLDAGVNIIYIFNFKFLEENRFCLRQLDHDVIFIRGI